MSTIMEIFAYVSEVFQKCVKQNLYLQYMQFDGLKVQRG